ncbi:threonylcarbamoyladenosine tRNA methylthiotransferase [Frankliniella occidentalis]|uniref:tRNA-t(6)A37 methylthiotransferase n=1 Tax=Frankliniella occidentalis TaxID=133901 RepID=A0A6J1RX18_FRAOC|nr:threonylcarbamoyladenosine tRNA methylthiotransferase [Frankliniella occidentalis]XP_026273505.1 threonylcarbamoyladenosine tRNA methylthiotransferase [Frankliniella occidentalis]
MPGICNEIIDDIEDLISSQDITPKERYSTRRAVTFRPKKHQDSKGGQASSENCINEESASTEIPGTGTVYVKTWGCTHNGSDSEYMAGQLAAYGYKLTDKKEEAHLWLLNSCTVKNPAEDHFRNEIADAKRLGKHIVLAGCVPQGAPKAEYLQGLSVIGVQQIDRVVEVVEETLKGNSVRFLGQKKTGGKKLGGASLELPKVRRNDLIEIIAINTGCLNQCTYCKTKHARGDLGSYPPDEIVARAVQSFSEGVKEIWLTSEDTGTYGRDIGTSLPELLWKLVEVIPEGCMLRIGMTNPPYILEHLEEMANILAHPKVYSFLHVPVQSGSDAVLTDMKREYCRKDFENVVDYLKERVPGMTIATDIICGFPTETETDFEDTVSLCAKHKFPSLFINQFFPRPGTPAAKMIRAATTQEVKKRTKRLSELFQSYEPYTHKLGEIQDILVTEISHDKKHYVGHNKFYEQVLVPQATEMLGKMIKVKIIATQKHCMIAEPVEATSKEEQYAVMNGTIRLRNNGTILNGMKKQNSFSAAGDSDTITLRGNRFTRTMLVPLLVLGFTILIRLLWTMSQSQTTKRSEL